MIYTLKRNLTYLRWRYFSIGAALSLEGLLSFHEVGLHLDHQLLLHVPDGVSEGGYLTVPRLDARDVLLQLLFVRGELNALRFKLVSIVLQHLSKK